MKPSGNPNQVPNLYILDIDGTLMPSAEIDNRCYWQAVDDVLGGAPGPQNLAGFTHVTDSGVLREWVMRQHGRAPTDTEILDIRQCFIKRIRQAGEQYPEAFRPLPGLTGWLDQQLRRTDCWLALATGGWGHTARFKLQASGLAGYALPLASSDDASSRIDIMRLALHRCGLPPGEPANITYIGDGPWDLAASMELGWNFIGIARGEDQRQLRAAGASQVYTDFTGLLQGPTAEIDRVHAL